MGRYGYQVHASPQGSGQRAGGGIRWKGYGQLAIVYSSFYLAAFSSQFSKTSEQRFCQMFSAPWNISAQFLHIPGQGEGGLLLRSLCSRAKPRKLFHGILTLTRQQLPLEKLESCCLQYFFPPADIFESRSFQTPCY